MSSESAGPTRHSGAPRRAFPVRASDLLKVRAVWILPLILGCVVVVLITAFYVGSVVDPLAHLHGLPVAVVNQDRGAVIGTTTTDPSTSGKIQTARTFSRSEARMGKAPVDAPLGLDALLCPGGAGVSVLMCPP